jgi:predicted dehydrogenase
MARRLRIGVIGLGGRRWPRYRQALLALKKEVRVQAVCDAAAAVAQEEARLLGCAASAGVVELVERDDVDAVLLTGGQWHGLWPLTRAAKANKPALTAGSLLRDGRIDEVRAAVEKATVHVTTWPAFELLMEAAGQQLGESLGSPRLALAAHVSAAEDVDPLDSGATLALVNALADVFASAPRRVSATGSNSSALVSLGLEFESGVARVALWGGPAEAARTWIEVECEGGSLRAEMPRRLGWRDAEGRHALELPGGLAEVWVVDRFAQAVRNAEPPALSFERAYQALTWLRAARQSLDKGGAAVDVAPAAG